jgi:hypothetical protein
MSPKSSTHVDGESDGRIVPMKGANKDGPPSAERQEGRRPTKENTEQPTPVIRKYSIRQGFSAISVCNDDPTEAGVPSCGTLSHAETRVPVNRVADCRAVTR